ncbi:helix-turn-helix transcriptional regulator [Desulfosporosinus sp. OT]|uniref:helix-turn-helix domain-containing protein n=1 Tax=Desulfosporosinus sp. OT TaxID=913865 RepID=UPI000223A904|nr:helix-turn-helix transcriptional regulator [Desulfosporosinus sp. OT]EGW39062.1 helix-turn-helix family protein [Desulfosporosinus sp. OT]
MIGKRIVQLRKERGWTQNDLAKAARLSKGYISAIEEGDQRPKVKTVAMIANALGVGVKDLLK